MKMTVTKKKGKTQQKHQWVSNTNGLHATVSVCNNL